MCAFERLTVSRVARCSAMRSRVWRARRSRASFFVFILEFLLLFRFLDLHAFVDVANALALVRLGRPVRANLRRDLADLLLVDALDDDLGLLRRFDLHALRHPMN